MHRFIALIFLSMGLISLVAACTSAEAHVYNPENIVAEAQETANIVLAFTDTPTPTNTPEPTQTPMPTATSEPEEDSPEPPNEQIAAGKEVYETICYVCHGIEFEGGAGPKLIKPVLRFHVTANGLYGYVSSSMPENDPGSLEEQQYYDVVSYLLWYNGMFDGSVVIGPDNAADISLQN